MGQIQITSHGSSRLLMGQRLRRPGLGAASDARRGWTGQRRCGRRMGGHGSWPKQQQGRSALVESADGLVVDAPVAYAPLACWMLVHSIQVPPSAPVPPPASPHAWLCSGSGCRFVFVTRFAANHDTLASPSRPHLPPAQTTTTGRALVVETRKRFQSVFHRYDAPLRLPARAVASTGR